MEGHQIWYNILAMKEYHLQLLAIIIGLILFMGLYQHLENEVQQGEYEQCLKYATEKQKDEKICEALLD